MLLKIKINDEKLKSHQQISITIKNIKYYA